MMSFIFQCKDISKRIRERWYFSSLCFSRQLQQLRQLVLSAQRAKQRQQCLQWALLPGCLLKNIAVQPIETPSGFMAVIAQALYMCLERGKNPAESVMNQVHATSLKHQNTFSYSFHTLIQEHGRKHFFKIHSRDIRFCLTGEKMRKSHADGA